MERLPEIFNQTAPARFAGTVGASWRRGRANEYECWIMGYSPNSLTSSIYEMALGRSNWDGILDILAATFQGCLITVSGDNVATGVNLAASQRGVSPAAAASYISTYAALNPVVARSAEVATYQVFHDDQLVDRAEASAGRFHREWLSRQGDFGASTGVVAPGCRW